MRKLLLFLLPFFFLITTTVSADSNTASVPGTSVGSRPAIAHPLDSAINDTDIPELPIFIRSVPSLLFGVVSDIHVQSTNLVAQNKFAQMLGDMVQLQVPNLIINGDLGDGSPQDYHTLDRLISHQKSSPAILYALGNHEFYKAYRNSNNGWSPQAFPNGETDDMALNRFSQLTGQDQVYYDKYLKGYHFIFLGSEKSVMSDPNIGDRAYLSNEQLQWLESKLKEKYTLGKPIFVFLHQPLINHESTKNNFIIQGERLREILKRFSEVIFFSGHMHRELKLPATALRDRFLMISSSSVYLPRDSYGKFLPNKSEGLVIQVIKNNVVIKGRNFMTQTWIPGTTYEF
ncbi:MAG TPA: metallophosphoesterase [Desulfosporosinus sp.]|nr:metallophosphoesterase [Desulfosporosinus sp.]